MDAWRNGVIRATCDRRVVGASERAPVIAAASVYLSAGDTKKMKWRRADGSGSIVGGTRVVGADRRGTGSEPGTVLLLVDLHVEPRGTVAGGPRPLPTAAHSSAHRPAQHVGGALFVRGGAAVSSFALSVQCSDLSCVSTGIDHSLDPCMCLICTVARGPRRCTDRTLRCLYLINQYITSCVCQYRYLWRTTRVAYACTPESRISCMLAACPTKQASAYWCVILFAY